MKLSQKVKDFLRSTSIILSVSFLGSFGLFLFSVNFWASFVLFVVFQFILFSFVGSILKHYMSEERRKKELDKLESLSTILNCAYCNKQNLMTFDPNNVERIEFECDHCKKKNLVSIQFVVSQITQPLDIPKVVGIPSESLENA